MRKGEATSAVPSGLTGYARPYLWAIAAVAVAGIVAAAVEKILPLPNISLVFLSAVLLVAIRFGTAPALFTAVVGLGAYNFFFTEPYFTFNVAYRNDVLTLLFFVLVAVLTGNLAGRARSQFEALRQSTAMTDNLYDFSRKVSEALSLDDVRTAIVDHVAGTFGAEVILDLESDEEGNAAVYPPSGITSARDECGAIPQELVVTRATDSGTRILAPLWSSGTALGAIAVVLPPGHPALTPDQARLLQALADRAAVAIAHARLATNLERARVLAESESLRSALLSSVSHDLRTPLVSIIGAAATLSSVWDSLSASDRHELTGTILKESQRLNRLVQNLLDMTRLSHGRLAPRFDWVDLREVVGRAVFGLRETLKAHVARVLIAEQVPLLYLDPVLMEQVFVNLLDNAAKHAPAGSEICIEAKEDGQSIEIRVEDEGPGIAPADREAVFEMFTRIRATDSHSDGAGLGLAICKGFVAAYGGTIFAATGRTGQGTAIVIRLPVRPLPEDMQEDSDAA